LSLPSAERRRECDVTVDKTQSRILNVNESFTLTLHVADKLEDVVHKTEGMGGGQKARNKPVQETRCETVINVYAPAFDVKPERASFLLPDDDGRSVRDFTFALLAKQSGSQVLVINYIGGEDRLGYSVRTYGLVPVWASPFIGTVIAFFGPILTLPWWIERRQKREEEKARQKAEEESERKSAIILP